MPAKTRSYVVSGQVKCVPYSAAYDLFKVNETQYYPFIDHKDDLTKSQHMFCKFNSADKYNVSDIEISCVLEDLAAYTEGSTSNSLGDIITIYMTTVNTAGRTITIPAAYLRLSKDSTGPVVEYMLGYDSLGQPRADQLSISGTTKKLTIKLNKSQIEITDDSGSPQFKPLTGEVAEKSVAYFMTTIGCLYTYTYPTGSTTPTITVSEQLNNCKIKRLQVKLTGEPLHRFIPCRVVLYDQVEKLTIYKRYLGLYCSRAQSVTADTPLNTLITCRANTTVSLDSLITTEVTGDSKDMLYAPFMNPSPTIVNPRSLAMKEVEYV